MPKDFQNIIISRLQGIYRVMAEVANTLDDDKETLNYEETSIFNRIREDNKNAEENGYFEYNGDFYDTCGNKRNGIPIPKQYQDYSIDVDNLRVVRQPNINEIEDSQNHQIEMQKADNILNEKKEPMVELSKEKWAETFIKENSLDKRVANNLSKYEKYFEDASQATGVPKNLLKAICMKESTYGVASNVMQLEPATAKLYGVNRYNPKECIMGAALFIKELIENFKDETLPEDYILAKTCIAYNTGQCSKATKAFRVKQTNDETVLPSINKGGYADMVMSFMRVFDDMDKQKT